MRSGLPNCSTKCRNLLFCSYSRSSGSSSRSPRIPYERLRTTSVACDFRTVRRRGETAYRKRRFIASGPENEVVGNEAGFDKIGRAVSEDPLSVPDGPGSLRLPYEHVESVARVCSPLRSVLQKQRFGRVVDQVEKIVGGRDESVGNAGRLFDIRMHPDWGGIDNERCEPITSSDTPSYV